MNTPATFDLTREYYAMFYDAWLKDRSRWRRFSVPLATIVLIAAVAGYSLVPIDRSLKIGLVLIALFNAGDAFSHRWRWIRGRTNTLSKDKHIQLHFRQDDVAIVTPNSEGIVRYNGFTDVTVAENGIFLVPDTGVSIFVPHSAFNSNDDFHGVADLLKHHSTHS